MSKDMVISGPQINQFNSIGQHKVPRSKFIRSHSTRTTFNQDYLVPIFTDEVLPGDDMSLKMSAFTRMSTPIKPLMDNLYQETFWFFIPNRLVWDNWKKFQGEQATPASSVAYTVPVLNNAVAPMSTTGFVQDSIYDHFELPIGVTSLDSISALYNRAYDLIWNEWFRNENIQDSITVATGDGPDDPATYALRKRNKRKDYFTSALPWPQKGTAVTLPLGTRANVLGIGKFNQTYGAGQTVYESDGTTTAYSTASAIDDGAANSKFFVDQIGSTGYPNIYADLSSATAASINSLRQAALYQQILELDARGGTRYVEALFSRFGVVSPDFRLQRPELLGQGSSRINMYAVPQSNATGATGTPQGNLSAFATNVIQGHGFHYSATEHGMVIGLVNVRADLTYQQGVPKRFLRSTRYDFYEPLLNGLGEQAILNNELWADGTSADQTVFGYQERWAEYRYKPSTITGLFRSTASGTLDIWHLAQKFTAVPTLNSTFITEAVPMSRILAVNTEPSFLMDAYFEYSHVRPMPMRSNPGIDIL